MRRHTRSQLLAISNIPNTPGKPAFDELWKAVRLHLRSEPSGSIGVMGPQKGGRGISRRLSNIWTAALSNAIRARKLRGSGESIGTGLGKFLM